MATLLSFLSAPCFFFVLWKMQFFTLPPLSFLAGSGTLLGTVLSSPRRRRVHFSAVFSVGFPRGSRGVRCRENGLGSRTCRCRDERGSALCRPLLATRRYSKSGSAAQALGRRNSAPCRRLLSQQSYRSAS